MSTDIAELLSRNEAVIARQQEVIDRSDRCRALLNEDHMREVELSKDAQIKASSSGNLQQRGKTERQYPTALTVALCTSLLLNAVLFLLVFATRGA